MSQAVATHRSRMHLDSSVSRRDGACSTDKATRSHKNSLSAVRAAWTPHERVMRRLLAEQKQYELAVLLLGSTCLDRDDAA
jgi:hypothetical protein